MKKKSVMGGARMSAMDTLGMRMERKNPMLCAELRVK
jgi:hypothetical protein